VGVSQKDESFVHLHVHTEYSMLDGAAKITDLVNEVARQEMPAVAMTDHGVMFGAYEFWRTARAAGVNPIMGIEAYLTPGTHRSDKTRVQWGNGGEDDVSGAGAYTHITLLAESTEGMHMEPRCAATSACRWPVVMQCCFSIPTI
jgi:DNA polymerase-3 subunit alpha